MKFVVELEQIFVSVFVSEEESNSTDFMVILFSSIQHHLLSKYASKLILDRPAPLNMEHILIVRGGRKVGHHLFKQFCYSPDRRTLFDQASVSEER